MFSRQQLVDACHQILIEKLKEINFSIAQANEAIAGDTKSSAGDKYETSREMIQQDLNRLDNQKRNIQEQLDTLSKIDIDIPRHQSVTLGALVTMESQHLYFLSVSLGKILIGTYEVIALSPLSPLGNLLLNNTVGDEIAFQGKVDVIKEIS